MHIIKYRPLFYLLLGLSMLVTAGCQRTVYLMPTPAIMATGELNPFDINPNLEESNRIDVLFATNRMPLGEIYYAAADEGIDSFVENLGAYLDIPLNVTFTINLKDTVLSLAQLHHGVSRAGRPKEGDLNPEEIHWIQRASIESSLDIISVDDKTVTGMSPKFHDFWYRHPWISSDMLVQFMFHADPRKRGLVENHNENGLRYWTFPPDYPDRIINIILQAQKEEVQTP